MSEQMPEQKGQQKGNSTTVIIIIAVIVLLGIIAYAAARNNDDTSTVGNTNQTNTATQVPTNSTPANTNTGTMTPTNTTPPTNQPTASTVTVTGANFSFSPNTIRVKRGDQVRINFVNSSGVHDFVIDEFNVKTPVLQNTGSSLVEFTADKTGSFEFYCSVGNHRQMGMRGTLIVE